MNVLDKLEQIRGSLNKGEDVLLEKQTFVELVCNSKAVRPATGGLCLDFGNSSVFLEFNTKDGALARVLRVCLPQTLNSGSIFGGPTSVV